MGNSQVQPMSCHSGGPYALSRTRTIEVFVSAGSDNNPQHTCEPLLCALNISMPNIMHNNYHTYDV